MLENTETVHYRIVCTLCSCYPTSLLGLPPDWYKSFAYRSRAVVDLYGVMGEFCLAVGDDVGVRVVEITADLRYLLLLQRPEGSEGNEGMTEKEIITLVTFDSIIDVGCR